MLIVALIQFFAVSLTITALILNTLMLSPEQNGVTCNITSKYYPKKNITAEHLAVYWGWDSLVIRWDYEGLQDTQIWFRETYAKTYDYKCKRSPTPAPILTQKPTFATKPPTLSPTNSSTTTTTLNTTHTLLQRFSIQQNTSSHIKTYSNNMDRKLLSTNDDENENMISFEVPQSLQYNSVLSTHSMLPSIFYPLPPLQNTDSYGSNIVEYSYPFKVTAVYDDDDAVHNKTLSPTSAPTTSASKDGCDDLQIVIETGKSYFSLLVCGLLCACIGLLLLIPPTCHLVNMKTRRLLKQIIIGLNTVSFMLLLMAFAVWFAYFSTNINSVLENKEGNAAFSICILGEANFGESIGFLLSGWLLIGFATMSACYLGNKPKSWYQFLSKQRGTGKTNKFQINQSIQEERDSDIDSDEDDNYDQMIDDDDDGYEDERLARMINRTPSSNSQGSNDTYMTADVSFGHHKYTDDRYPVAYSPN